MKPPKPVSRKRTPDAPKSALPLPDNHVIRFDGPVLKGEPPRSAQSEFTPIPVVIPPDVREAITGKRLSDSEKNLLIDAPRRHRARGYNIPRPQDPK